MNRHYDICEIADVLLELSDREAGALLKAVCRYRRGVTGGPELFSTVKPLFHAEVVKIEACKAHSLEVSERRREAILKRWKNTNEYKCIQMNTNVFPKVPLSTPIENTPTPFSNEKGVAPKGAASPENGTEKVPEKRKVFQPPTLDEVREFARTRNSITDPEEFWNFYESNGWMVGKNKMKSWTCAFQRWEREDARRSQSAAPKAQPRYDLWSGKENYYDKL